MRLPEQLKRIAACAQGRRVTVVTAAGKTYELPLAPVPEAPAAPHPLESVSQQLLSVGTETRAAVADMAKAVVHMGETVKAAVADVVEGQAGVAERVNEISGTLHLPVKPVYDKAGKLIGAQRVKKL